MRPVNEALCGACNDRPAMALAIGARDTTVKVMSCIGYCQLRFVDRLSVMGGNAARMLYSSTVWVNVVCLKGAAALIYVGFYCMYSM